MLSQLDRNLSLNSRGRGGLRRASVPRHGAGLHRRSLMTDPSGKRPRAIADLLEGHETTMAMLSEGQRQQQQQQQQPSGWGGTRPPSPSQRGTGAAGAALSAAIPGAMGVPPVGQDSGGPLPYTYNNYSPGSDGRCARCGQAEGEHYHHANGYLYCPRVVGAFQRQLNCGRRPGLAHLRH